MLRGELRVRVCFPSVSELSFLFSVSKVSGSKDQPRVMMFLSASNIKDDTQLSREQVSNIIAKRSLAGFSKNTRRGFFQDAWSSQSLSSLLSRIW
jgi:hypothetical protein